MAVITTFNTLNDIIDAGGVPPSTFFRQYALRFPKRTPSDAWDAAMKAQLAAERKRELDPERAYPREKYESFTTYGPPKRPKKKGSIYGPRRPEFYRYRVANNKDLDALDKGLMLLWWGFDPEVFDTPGARELLRKGRKARPVGGGGTKEKPVGPGAWKLRQNGTTDKKLWTWELLVSVNDPEMTEAIEPHTEAEINKLRDKALADAAALNNYVSHLREDWARLAVGEDPEKRRFLIRPRLADGVPIMVFNGEHYYEHYHGKAPSAINCATKPGSEMSPNPCFGRVHHFLVRDDRTYRSDIRVGMREDIKPSDIYPTVPEQVDVRKKTRLLVTQDRGDHKHWVITRLVDAFDGHARVQRVNENGKLVWGKRLGVGAAAGYYSAAWAPKPDPEIPLGLGPMEVERLLLAHALLPTPYEETLKAIAARVSGEGYEVRPGAVLGRARWPASLGPSPR